MKQSKLFSDVPVSGDGLLVVPRATDIELVNVLGMAVLSLADVLRHEPRSYVFRCADGRPGIVFSEPAPRPLVELLVDLLDASEEPVRLEELELLPVMRLSPAGIRVYVPEGPGPLHPGAGPPN